MTPPIGPLVLALAMLSLGGCSCGTEVVACPPVPYTTEDLVACQCAPPMPDGLLSAVVAGPGSFAADSPAVVTLAGIQVGRGTTGGDGSLAVMILVPSTLRLELAGNDLVVQVARTTVVTHVNEEPTAVLESPTGIQFIQEESNVLHLEGTLRATRWIDCDDPIEPTSDPRHIFAGNLGTGQATVVDAPPLEAPFDVSVPGAEGDVAVVVVGHHNGGVSGCFYSADVCCNCPGGGLGGGSPFAPAVCTPALRASGGCTTRVTGPTTRDAGSDAGRIDADVHAIDANVDANVDASREDGGPPV